MEKRMPFTNHRSFGECRIVKDIGQRTRRKPVKRLHRGVVGAAVVGGKLYSEVVEGKEGMGRIEAFLVFPVAALHLAVVAGRIGADV